MEIYQRSSKQRKSLGGHLLLVLVVVAQFVVFKAAAEPISAPGKKGTDAGATPQLTCPKDFSLEGGSCARTIYQPPTASCPPGYEPIYEDEVEQRHRDRRSSGRASGYDGTSSRRRRYSSKKSEETHERHAKSDHDSHAYPQVAQCIKLLTDDVRRSCPTGFDRDVINGELRCIQFEAASQSKQSVCSDGYSLRSDGCVLSMEHTPSLDCTEGFTMVGETCKRLLDMNPMEGCDEGYMLEGNACVRVDRRAPALVCPRGSVPSGNGNTCTTRRTTPAIPECPPRHVMRGDRCVLEEVVFSVQVCSQDERMTSNGCIQERILDVQWGCEDGFQWVPEEHACVMRRDPVPRCTAGQYNPSREVCEYQEAVLPAVVCPPGFQTTDNGECKRVNMTNIEHRCPRGETLEGRNCVSEENAAPDTQCPEEYMLIENSCFKPTYKRKWQKCQAGFRLSGGRCVAMEELAPRMICPAGYDLTLNKCLREAWEPPTVQCTGETQLRDGECIYAVSRRPLVECDPPYVYNPDTEECEDEESVEPEYQCPKGFTLEEQCVRVETVRAIPQCADGRYYQVHTDSCKVKKRFVPVPVPSPSKKSTSSHYRTSPSHATMTHSSGSFPSSSSSSRSHAHGQALSAHHTSRTY